MAGKAKLADHIEYAGHAAGYGELWINGEEFPWFIAENGISVGLGKGDVPSVTVTILAEHVEARQSMGRAPVIPGPNGER